MDYTKHEIYEIVSLITYITIFIGIATLAFGLGPSSGFDKDVILQKTMFYIGFGVLFLFGLVGLKIAGIFLFGKKHANIEGVVIHDPEQSIFPNLRLFQNPFLLFFFSVIFFGFLGWLASRYQTFFVALPNYEMQFTKGAELFFSVYPASPSETLGALFLISLLGFFLGYMVLKEKLSKAWFLIMYIPGSAIISMVYGIINHISRYGEQQIAMSSVALFWFIGGLITSITGSCIPFFVMHDSNNAFVALSSLFDSDIITYVTFSILGIASLIILTILFKGKKGVKTQ